MNVFFRKGRKIITSGLALVGLGTVATKVEQAQESAVNWLVIGLATLFVVLIFRR